MGKHSETCNRCKTNPKGGPGGNKSWCPDCTREYRRLAYRGKHKTPKPNGTWYERNRENVLAARVISFERNCDELRSYFETHPCVDCGEKDILYLDFDHLYDKEFGISRMMRTKRWSQILVEIAKCEVVCIKCHRLRTATRGGWWRLE